MAKINWIKRNKVTQVWNQNIQTSCGSCWAWATASALESSILIREHWNYDSDIPSYKQLCCNPKTMNDCCPSCYEGDSWCNGGYPARAFDYCKDEGLHQRYVTHDGWLSHHPPCGDMAYQMKDSYIMSGSDIDIIKSQVDQHPCLLTLKVHLDFYDYIDGIYDWDGISSFVGYHAMNIVGYSDEGQFFLIKNSWGTDWGHEGFCKIAYSYFSNNHVCYVLSPIQGSYSLSCKANGSKYITVSPSDNVEVMGKVMSDHVTDPVNYFLIVSAPNGEVSYLEPSDQWTQTFTPYKVGEIENWNHTMHSGTLSVGVWRFYILLDHNVYHIENSPFRSKFCEITVV